MFEKLSAYFTDTLIEGNVISKRDRKLYLYCFETVFELIFDIGAILAIGSISARLIPTLIFMLVFFTLRSKAGGIHCRNSTECFIISLAVYLLTAFSYDCIEMSFFTKLLICLTSLICTICFSPADGPKRKLSEAKRRENRMHSIILVFVYSLLCMVIEIKNNVLSNVIIISMSISVISMIVGKLYYKKNIRV